MIKYNLKCNNNHEFESWFLDSREFEKLKKKKLLGCIYCNSNVVDKSIMSPMVSVAEKDLRVNNLRKVLKEEKKQLLKIRNFIEKNFEYVGDNLSKRVREIYYDDKSKKTVYGTASEDERKDLAEEGIALLSIPWIKKDN